MPCNVNHRWKMTFSYKETAGNTTKERFNDIRYRQGDWKDVGFIFAALWSEKMNIMGACSPHHFLLAYEPKDDCRILGFGQVKPISKRTRKLASLYVYPEYRGCGIGSAIVDQLLER